MSGEVLFDSLPERWEATTLGEVVRRGAGSIQTGPFGSQLHASDYVPVGVPSIMPVNIGDNRIIEEGIARIREADAERLSRHRVQPGDIIYSRRGDVERRALVRAEQKGWLCGTGCLKVCLGDGVVDPLFASYYLGHPAVRRWIVRHAVGATMPNLNTEIMEAVPFALPPIAEQRAIAAVLGALDDKIELNRRMCRTLEGIARAIFQAWFVDFEPVRAKAAGAKSFRGMPQAVFDTLPTAFVDSPLGPIPKGWAVQALDEIAEFLNGLALQKFPPHDGRSLPVIKIAQLRAGHTAGADQASADIDPAYVVGDGDVLFSWSGSLECILWAGGPGALNQHLFKVTSDRSPKWFYYHWIHHHLDHFRHIAAGKATTMGHIQRHHLSEAKVVVPPPGILRVADELLAPTIDAIPAKLVQARTLAALRDALLPKLVSGELRIRDVERIIGRCA